MISLPALVQIRCAASVLPGVGVAGVHLLQVRRAVINEEPDAGGALQRWLVLPTLVGLSPRVSVPSSPRSG